MIIAVLICHVSFNGITLNSSGQVLRYRREMPATAPYSLKDPSGATFVVISSQMKACRRGP